MNLLVQRNRKLFQLMKEWHNISYYTSYLHTATMWTTTHFPAAMRSLSPTTRAKAIELANQLQAQGQLDNQHVIAVSVDEARQWARLSRSKQEWVSLSIQTFA